MSDLSSARFMSNVIIDPVSTKNMYNIFDLISNQLEDNLYNHSNIEYFLTNQSFQLNYN
jgi:hypothetical protein